MKALFHQRSHSIKGHLPSKGVFHQRFCSTKGHPPSKGVFRTTDNLQFTACFMVDFTFGSREIFFLDFLRAIWPPDSGLNKYVSGRMSLLVTLFLVLVNIFNFVSANAPKAEGLTAVETWVVSCIIHVFGVLAEYALILKLIQDLKREELMERRKEQSLINSQYNNGKDDIYKPVQPVREKDIF